MRPFSTIDLQRMLDDFDAQGFGAGGVVSTSPQPSTIVKPLSALGKMQSASTADAIATLEAALAFISPDTLRGMGTIFGSDGAPVTDCWFGWATAFTLGHALPVRPCRSQLSAAGGLH